MNKKELIKYKEEVFLFYYNNFSFDLVLMTYLNIIFNGLIEVADE